MEVTQDADGIAARILVSVAKSYEANCAVPRIAAGSHHQGILVAGDLPSRHCNEGPGQIRVHVDLTCMCQLLALCHRLLPRCTLSGDRKNRKAGGGKQTFVLFLGLHKRKTEHYARSSPGTEATVAATRANWLRPRLRTSVGRPECDTHRACWLLP